MKKSLRTKLLLLMCIVVTVILTGCGNKEEDDNILQIEPVSQIEQPASTESNQKQEDTVKSNTEENTDELTELYGDVVSIGEASVVVSKIYIESSASGQGDVMVIAGGGDNQELINVYFEKDASFVYQTIRNGGKDVETREGSFSDITEGVMLDMTGRYEGEDFWANDVEISYVVLGEAW